MGGCLAPMSPPWPDGPSIQGFAPVTQAYVKRSDSIVSYQYGTGGAYIKDDIFIYRGRWRGQLSFYLKDIQKVSLETAFRDKYTYHRPYYCWTCEGCLDGIADIRGSLEGVDFHVGLAMPNAEEFVEQLQARIGQKNLDF